jgi:hypothetical protein
MGKPAAGLQREDVAEIRKLLQPRRECGKCERTGNQRPRRNINRQRINYRDEVSPRFIFCRPPVPSQGCQINPKKPAGRQRGKRWTPHHQPRDQTVSGADVPGVNHYVHRQTAECENQREVGEDLFGKRSHGAESYHSSEMDRRLIRSVTVLSANCFRSLIRMRLLGPSIMPENAASRMTVANRPLRSLRIEEAHCDCISVLLP